jgi:hypothetical protein
MLEVAEKPSVCSTRRTFCDWHELLLEKAARVVEGAASSIRNAEVMLKSFIEGVMSRVEAKLGENEEHLRALERKLDANGPELLRLGRAKAKLKRFAARVTHFFSRGFSGQLDVDADLKKDCVRLKLIRARITENETCEDRMLHTCLGNTGDPGLGICSSTLEHGEISLNADLIPCDPVANAEV